ncbi:MAG: hypothetical protein Tsb0013_05410 [Phycisphaerales bacterium]
MNMIQKLRSLAAEIESAKSDKAVSDAWALVGRLIGRTPADPADAAAAIDAQDLPALVALLDRLEGKGPAPTSDEAPAPAGTGSDGTTPVFSHDDLAAAMRAFKRRLKLVRLDEESRLGSKQLSGGRKSQVDAIMAPSEYPREMWQHLAREGRLVDQGGGFYGLPG